MSLSTQEQILIEQRVTNEAKSTGAAYLIWFFLGMFGMHRFYLGKTGTGAAILALTILGLVLTVVGVGLVMLGVAGIWVLIDAFLIPGMVSEQKNTVREKFTLNALANNKREVVL